MKKTWGCIAVALVLIGAACGGPAQTISSQGHTKPPNNLRQLTKALAAIENTSRYKQSDWGYSIVDDQSGAVITSQNADKMFDTGSTMKTYAVSTALRLYGPNYKFHTPVFKQGKVDHGTLTGNLVLVASGDMSLGLREEPNGTLYYDTLPKVDHSYATTGLPGPVEPPGDPLAGLNQLAAQVRASGITHVNGNVAIDDRLFESFDGFPDGNISSIWVNENLIDVLVTPGAKVGAATSVSWRPMTATYTLDNEVTTVAASEGNQLSVTQPTPGHLVVTGHIAVGSVPTLAVHEIDDPASFARTAFIEALQRAGVSVTATPTGPNPALAKNPDYQASDKVAEHVSGTLAQFVKLIMKVSYNRGADLMTCLAAVKTGSTDCEDGLVAEHQTITGLGLPDTTAFAFDGAGSNDQDRTTPNGLAQFYRLAKSQSYGPALADALPIMGKDGTASELVPDSPAAGHVQIKTGNRVVGTPAGQIIVLGNSLAGDMVTKSGRHLSFGITVGNVPLASALDFPQISDDQAQMIVAIYEAL